MLLSQALWSVPASRFVVYTCACTYAWMLHKQSDMIKFTHEPKQIYFLVSIFLINCGFMQASSLHITSLEQRTHVLS